MITLKDNARPIDIEEVVSDSLNECYPVVSIGGLEFYPADIVKELDPTAFRCMEADESSRLLDDDQAVEVDGELYWKHDVEEVEEDEDDEGEDEEGETEK